MSAFDETRDFSGYMNGYMNGKRLGIYLTRYNWPGGDWDIAIN